MTTTLRWGILSTADIGRKKVIPGMKRAARCEVAAIGSRDAAAAQRVADELGIPRVHGSYEALLADPEIDAVYIPVPNHLHAEWTIAAARAGKHVLCEKPLALSAADAERMAAICEAEGVRLMEAFMYRLHPSWVAVRQLVASGRIGELRAVQSWFSFFNDDPANIRNIRETGGGALMDVGCYCVSGLRLLAGEPLRVSAERVGTPVDGRVAAVLRFANDVTGTFDCGMDVYNRAGLEVVGDQDTLWIADPWHGQSPGIVLASGERIEVERVNPYGQELLEVEAAVREGRAPALDRAESVGQARTIDALYRSAEEGRAITLTSG
jgi:predicted dehydrogenase